MRIAFCAPLKPPDDAVPSGDRAMARLLMAALAAAGHDVSLASRLRSFDATGDPARQARLGALGQRLAKRLIRRYRAQPPAARPELWFTYHLYHKAPDWLGPAVSRELAIPYVVAEASHAEKQAAGPWAPGWRAARAAIAQADLVVGLNPADAPGVAPLLAAPSRWLTLPPFIDVAAVRRAAGAARAGAGEPQLLTVAMLRPGAKLASYRLLAAALGLIAARPWRLFIAGDGPARAQVAALFAPLGERVSLLGRVDPPDLYRLYATTALYLWPAIGEAYGMAMLEAHALGVPVVAAASGGVGAIVRDGLTGILVPPGDAEAFARAVAALLDDADRRRAMAAAAAAVALAEHDIACAARTLAAGLDRLVTVQGGGR